MNGTQSDIVRRRINITSYSGPRLSAFRTAMKKFMGITDNRGYAHLAGYHGIPDWWCWHGISRNDRRPSVVRANAFLPWHRAYLKRVEDYFLDHDENLSLPWWDATSKLSHRDGIPKAYTDATADGEPNPLYSFHIPERINIPPEVPVGRDTHRNPRDRGRTLPASSRVEALWEISDFGEFSTALQQIHNEIHVWCGGHMRTQEFAAYDPVFWAHHCNIDRLWSIWQTMHGNNMPANLPDLQLEPFGYQVKDVLKIYDLGYEYAAAASEVKF
jgi:tyrosinase